MIILNTFLTTRAVAALLCVGVLNSASLTAAPIPVSNVSNSNAAQAPERDALDTDWARDLNHAIGSASTRSVDDRPFNQLSDEAQGSLCHLDSSVLVDIGQRQYWLNPGVSSGWREVEAIQSVGVLSLEVQGPSGEGLLDRLPFPAWLDQIHQAAIDHTEPPYNNQLSRILKRKLEAVCLSQQRSDHARSVGGSNSAKGLAAQWLLTLYGAFSVADEVIQEAAGPGIRNVRAEAGVCRGAEIASGAAFGSAATQAARAAVRSAIAELAQVEAHSTLQKVRQRYRDNPLFTSNADYLAELSYRSAQFAVQLVILKNFDILLDQVFSQTLASLPIDFSHPLISSIEGWLYYKGKLFDLRDERITTLVSPWFEVIDRFVDRGDSSYQENQDLVAQFFLNNAKN